VRPTRSSSWASARPSKISAASIRAPSKAAVDEVAILVHLMNRGDMRVADGARVAVGQYNTNTYWNEGG
jgi:hypothetical protein